MFEPELSIERKLIDQLCDGDSQWTYRPELKTEESLWENFRYILEQNNKSELKDIPLSDAEFAQIKGQISFRSFYDAGKWLLGESGRVYVHIKRGNETLHLLVINHGNIDCEKNVYEIINQYQAPKDNQEGFQVERNRRFDVTLMINGLPMIHIELKSRNCSYMDGFWQIKNYIHEGKFRGIFSTIQMFVVSNAVDTRYFAAARENDLNPKFLFQWLDKDNNPIPNYLDFAKEVLSVPAAHCMVSKYTVLDYEARKLLLLRPYQIHAMEAIRDASKKGQSGYIWHTTGSGKTMTSYKATRNLLMDISSIEKTVFLVDRKDLDEQTKWTFKSYADNDIIDVDKTDNVKDLIRKLANNERQMIVTTIQKMQIMINRKLKANHPDYKKIKSLKIAFVVDECHRAVSPETKRDFERFFSNSLWYGFTGTPRFPENAYPKKGDLPRTTDQLYGSCLHQYTIKDAIRDEAVLGFMNEYLCDSDMDPKDNDILPEVYEREPHMLMVLNTILNKSNEKFGISNGEGKTYDAILTVSSIPLAQKYYKLLKDIKEGKRQIKINDGIKKVLPDFPKFAITYSVSENKEGSTADQEEMKKAIADYNKMFGTHYGIGQLESYNKNLNDRLARKQDKFKEVRKEQLDLVIVVDRLLTGFDAPCLSTVFIDRSPLVSHGIIQAMSRTNRLFDERKKYGQIVTFQKPAAFKKAIDDALILFSAGGEGDAVAADWDTVEENFISSLTAIRNLASKPEDIRLLSFDDKEKFAYLFQKFDSCFTQLRSFTRFADKNIEDYGLTQKEYENYYAHYCNIIKEPGRGRGVFIEYEDDNDTDISYESFSFNLDKINYKYIIKLIQDYIDQKDKKSEKEVKAQIKKIRFYINEFRKENKKLGDMMFSLLDDVEENRSAYFGRNVSEILDDMKKKAINSAVDNFADKWCVNRNAVLYAVENYNNGDIPNERMLKDSMRYAEYKESTPEPLKKPKARHQIIPELKTLIEKEIIPLEAALS